MVQGYREELQTRHYALLTVAIHPHEMGSEEVNAFLTHLAVEGQVSVSTQNQAFSALLFLYRKLLERGFDLEGVVRARATRQSQSSCALHCSWARARNRDHVKIKCSRCEKHSISGIVNETMYRKLAEDSDNREVWI